MGFDIDSELLLLHDGLHNGLEGRIERLSKAGGPAAIGRGLKSNPETGILPASFDERKEA